MRTNTESILASSRILVVCTLLTNVTLPACLGDEVAGSPTPPQKPTPLATQLVDNDAGVAISGAWHRVKAALQNEVFNNTVRSRYKVPPAIAHRFLGFLEGRLQVSIPTSFSNCITNAEMWWNGHFRLPIQCYSVWRGDIQKEFALPSEMPVLKTGVENGVVVVRVGTGGYPSTGNDGDITLPPKLSKRVLAMGEGDFLPISSALFTEDRAFIAVTSQDSPGGSVYCLSRSGHKVLWTAVISDYTGGSYRGSGDWFTEMRVAADQLLLFNCCESSFSIEAIGLDGELRWSVPDKRQELLEGLIDLIQ